MGWSYTLDELAKAIGAESPDSDVTFSGVSTDTRTIRPGDVFFALQGENFDANAFLDQALKKGAVAVVASASTDAGICLVVDDALRALQDFAAFHRGNHPIPLIAITGSCGKTSSKDLIAEVLSEEYAVVKTQGNLNNEIGVPLSLLQINDDTDIAIVEMGANHPGEIARLCEIARPSESVITMIGAAHLEGFGTIEDVADAKSEIVGGLSEGGTFYVNLDDPRCRDIGTAFGGKKVTFGEDGDVTLTHWGRDASGQMLLEIDPVGSTMTLPLYTRAHAQNVLLAVAVGLQHGIRNFEAPLQRACEKTTRFKVYPVGPITAIDDTYNANPDSMQVALQALAEFPGEGKRIAVLGDMLELGDEAPGLHRDIGIFAGEVKVDNLFARGEFSGWVVEAARKAGVSNAHAFETHEEIADALAEIIEEGDVVLFKGSRGMAMEKVIQLLQQKYDSAASAAANPEG